jgi:hypothetical protein
MKLSAGLPNLVRLSLESKHVCTGKISPTSLERVVSTSCMNASSPTASLFLYRKIHLTLTGRKVKISLTLTGRISENSPYTDR